MCQLLGMNCAAPTDFSFSFRGFCKRGGLTDIHSNGFGLCVYGTPTTNTTTASSAEVPVSVEEINHARCSSSSNSKTNNDHHTNITKRTPLSHNGLRSFHDILPACQSPIAELVQNHPMRTLNMMAHIRYATQGNVSVENTHPFVRVWQGIQMCFSHNGDCPLFSTNNIYRHYNPFKRMNIMNMNHQNQHNTYNNNNNHGFVQFHPVGDTDSEAVFCAILNAMSDEFPNGLPTLPVLFEFLQSTCHEIIQQHNVTYGSDNCETPIILNFLLGVGPYTLFAYSKPGQRSKSSTWNGLHYIVRQPPFATATLCDDVNCEIDFSTVTTPLDRVAVIATKPLTYEKEWMKIESEQLLLFDHGKPYLTPQSCIDIEEQGRGLHSRTIPIVYTTLKNNCSSTSTTTSSTTVSTNTESTSANTTTIPPSIVDASSDASQSNEPGSGMVVVTIENDHLDIHPIKEENGTTTTTTTIPFQCTTMKLSSAPAAISPASCDISNRKYHSSSQELSSSSENNNNHHHHCVIDPLDDRDDEIESTSSDTTAATTTSTSTSATKEKLLFHEMNTMNLTTATTTTSV